MKLTRIVLTILLALLGAITVAVGQPVSLLRVQERFDSNWRFTLKDVPEAAGEYFDDLHWRHVDLPHDWSIEDLPGATSPTQSALSVTEGTWRFKFGDDPTWKDPKFDDTSWQEVKLPAHWREHSGKAPENAFGWYRRKFTVPPTMRGKDIVLLIGKVDDVDETFVNGVKVGGMGSLPPHYDTAWTISRRYSVPANLLKGDGTDVIAIRDYNGQADAGIYEVANAPRRSGPFDADALSGTAQGYTLGGVGWYRKTFTLLPHLQDHQIGITFDGVYMNAKIWFNGHLLGEHPYGYTSFHFDLTPYARFGNNRNVVTVRVDTSGRTSRWYSGSGIYRHVWLTATDPIHIAPWGIAVSIPEVSRERATVQVRTNLDNATPTEGPVTLTSTLVDAQRKVVATETGVQTVPGKGSHEFRQTLTVHSPALWSPDTPTLYHLVSIVRQDGKIIDEVRTLVGIRSVTFDAMHGMLLNGLPIKLRGGCVHHDNGCLGSCTYDRAEERRIEILKASGFNAIRTSHNPPSPGFLDACDRLGMLVMDEAFDCWKYGKNAEDYGRFFLDWWQRDLDAMVLRDRNHPCVILWSIGNEIPEQNSPEGAERAGMLASYVRNLDPTRPVTEATNPDADKLDPLLEHLDVTGYNYASGRFPNDEAKHPGRVFAQTESGPGQSFDGWMMVLDHPYAIGDFVWTAMDYLGEAGIGHTSVQNPPPGYTDDRLYTVSNCGDIDLLGQMRPQCYYRNALWNLRPNVAAFVQALGPDGKPERVEGWGWTDERPSWTWPGMEGKSLTVRAYSSCPQVRLLVNGKDLGTKETTRNTRFTGTWDVPYTPGELIAVGLDAQGKELTRWVLKTAGKATSLRLTPDRTRIANDGEDLSYITVDLLDSNGVLDANAENLVHFRLTGPGKILAVCNADPRSTESFQQPQRKAWHGRCLVVVRSEEHGGQIHLKAEADGLKSADTVITSTIVP